MKPLFKTLIAVAALLIAVSATAQNTSNPMPQDAPVEVSPGAVPTHEMRSKAIAFILKQDMFSEQTVRPGSAEQVRKVPSTWTDDPKAMYYYLKIVLVNRPAESPWFTIFIDQYGNPVDFAADRLAFK